jgi:tetratricopeptide (TPR) repeat protein
LLALFCCGSLLMSAQEKKKPRIIIDLDEALKEEVPQDLAQSYYHFALAKWHENQGDVSKALEEMQNAKRFNLESAALRVELASILYKSGDINGCIVEAEEAARLDPKNPDPHWLLARVYLTPGGRNRSVSDESYRKAAGELETMRELAPDDPQSYHSLGYVYFKLNQPGKAIAAYEKFQSLVPNTAEGFLAIAEYYESIGNVEKKVEYLEKALKQRPDSVQSLVELADSYAERKQSQKALPLYRKALELSGDNRSVKRRLASSLLDAGEFDEAGSLLEDLGAADSGDPRMPVLLARARIGEQRFQEAVDILKKAVEVNPGNIEAVFYLGDAYKQLGDLPQAAKVFSGLLEKAEEGGEELRANRVVFQQYLAETYQQMGEYGKAIELYQKMVADGGDQDPRLHFYLINALRLDRRFDQALAMGKERLADNPEDVSLALVYSRTLADAGKAAEGATVLQGFLESHPNDLDVYINLSQIYLQDKQYSRAEDVLRRAQDKNLDQERVKFQLATVYEGKKDFDRAETLFKEILKENPKNATALNYMGYMLADRGVRLDEAVRYVKEALAIEPNNGAYLDSLGWAYFKMDRYDEAEAKLLKAVELMKNDPEIHEHLGDLYYKTGDYEKARSYWEASLQHGVDPDEIEKVREKLKKLQDKVRKQKRFQ